MVLCFILRAGWNFLTETCRFGSAWNILWICVDVIQLFWVGKNNPKTWYVLFWNETPIFQFKIIFFASKFPLISVWTKWIISPKMFYFLILQNLMGKKFRSTRNNFFFALSYFPENQNICYSHSNIHTLFFKASAVLLVVILFLTK